MTKPGTQRRAWSIFVLCAFIAAICLARFVKYQYVIFDHQCEPLVPIMSVDCSFRVLLLVGAAVAGAAGIGAVLVAVFARKRR
jgi:hypothetical protein